MSIVDNCRIVTPVSVSDVMTVLGENTGSLAALCTSPRINRYSRFKPYPFGGIGAHDGDGWAATCRLNNYGLTPALLEGPDSSEDDGPQPDCCPAWSSNYRPPSGAYPDEPFRLADFDGYNHNAQLSGNYVYIGADPQAADGEEYTAAGPCYHSGSKMEQPDVDLAAIASGSFGAFLYVPRETSTAVGPDVNNTDALRLRDFVCPATGHSFGLMLFTMVVHFFDGEAVVIQDPYPLGTERWSTRADAEGYKQYIPWRACHFDIDRLPDRFGHLQDSNAPEYYNRCIIYCGLAEPFAEANDPFGSGMYEMVRGADAPVPYNPVIEGIEGSSRGSQVVLAHIDIDV